MKEVALHFFQQYPHVAVVSCFFFAVFVSLIGIIPSFFVTTAAVLFFSFWPGIAITFTGETLGAAIAFYLYRRGFKKSVSHQLEKHKSAQALLNANNREAFWLIFSLRLIPVLPSGLVTFTAAMGRASLLTFITAGALGKFPSLLLEGYAAFQVTEFGWQGKIILVVFAILLIYFVIRHIVRHNRKEV